MNRTEHIITVLAEEGGEVAKECSKALRFGLDDQVTVDPYGPRGTRGPTNRAKIQNEFIDMLGVYQMGVAAGILPDLGLTDLPYWVCQKMIEKANRVEAYMGYAARVGALDVPSATDALRLLIQAKDEKEAHGDTPVYQSLKATAWKAAREAVENSDYPDNGSF